jgi:hypothetical protein
MAGDKELKKTRGTKKVRKASRKRRRQKISKSGKPKAFDPPGDVEGLTRRAFGRLLRTNGFQVVLTT